MHISQVLESAFGVDNCEVDVEISIWLLGLFDHIDQFLDTGLELGGMTALFGIGGREEVTSGLDPERSGRQC